MRVDNPFFNDTDGGFRDHPKVSRTQTAQQNLVIVYFLDKSQGRQHLALESTS